VLEVARGEHIAIVGNTTAERLQHDGWLETMIQSRFPGYELTIRNLGFSGDEIATRLRSTNFGTPDEWLSGQAGPIGGYTENRFAGTNTRADIIFAFFGYNESYAGEAGVAAFRTDLGAWLTHTLAQRYNGRSAPRVVLFSPIAHENLDNPDLPDGVANNLRLALYTRAMGEVAAAAGVTFVDLFAPSTRLYAENRAPLTINGVHLNAEGNRLIAGAIDPTSSGSGRRSSTRTSIGTSGIASPTGIRRTVIGPSSTSSGPIRGTSPMRRRKPPHPGTCCRRTTTRCSANFRSSTR
jgi:lysophospholipase L1-like esterase